MATLTGGQKWFQRFSIASFTAIFLLTIIGGTVRITGSGMGCPDWPTCFGRIIPPTDVSQLPPDYQQIYADRGYATEEFNAVKTWIEYINRLFSAVVVGPLALGMLGFSFSWRKKDKTFIYLSVAVMVFILFEAWLGKTIVDSNLSHSKITAHLIGSLAIITLSAACIIRTQKYVEDTKEETSVRISGLALSVLLLLLVQIFLGTFVREEIDIISTRIAARGSWIGYATEYFPAHRLFSWVVTLAGGFLIYKLIRASNAGSLYRNSAYALILCLAGQMLTGLLLSYAGFPAVAQLLHLGFSIGMFSALVFILLQRSIKIKPAALGHMKAAYIG